jgi:hypothetical protein
MLPFSLALFFCPHPRTRPRPTGQVDVDGECVWRGRGSLALSTASVSVYASTQVTLRAAYLGNPSGATLTWLHPRVVGQPTAAFDGRVGLCCTSDSGHTIAIADGVVLIAVMGGG